MPQLIALGLVGGLAWYAFRAFKKQMAAVKEELKETEVKKKSPTKEIDELEKGPDGVYRPKVLNPKNTNKDT